MGLRTVDICFSTLEHQNFAACLHCFSIACYVPRLVMFFIVEQLVCFKS